MLLESQFLHGKPVEDLLPGADCSPELHCHHNSQSCSILSSILSICLFFRKTFPRPVLDRIYPRFFLRLDPSLADRLCCCCFCSGKFQSTRTKHLSSLPLPSSLPSKCSCLLPCILLLLLLYSACSSNLSSHHRGREHLW